MPLPWLPSTCWEHPSCRKARPQPGQNASIFYDRQCSDRLTGGTRSRSSKMCAAGPTLIVEAAADNQRFFFYGSSMLETVRKLSGPRLRLTAAQSKDQVRQRQTLCIKIKYRRMPIFFCCCALHFNCKRHLAALSDIYSCW